MLINEVINILLNKYNITINTLYNNTYRYIDNYINSIINNYNDIIRIKREVLELEYNIEHLTASIVGSGENYSIVSAGRNNGLIPNTTEMIQIEKIKLKEEINELILEKRDKEITFKANTSKFKEFITNHIKNDTHRLILELSYFYGMNSSEIEEQLDMLYTASYIRQIKERCKKKLAKIINKFIENNSMHTLAT